MTYAFASLTIAAALIYTSFKNMSVADLIMNRPGPGQPDPIAGNTSKTGNPISMVGDSVLGNLGGGLVTPKASWNPSSKPMCKWIAKELAKAAKAGIKFTVISGYRTYEEQVAACAGTSGPCATPGTSNHEKKKHPGCAVDIDGDINGLANYLKKINSPLKGFTVAGDAPHFSAGG